MAAPDLFTNQRYGASITVLSVITGLLLCLIPAASAQQPAGSRGERPELALQIGHRSFIYHVAVSPDGKTAASFSQDGTLKIWDTLNGDLLDTVAYPNDQGFDFGLGTMAFSADGQTIEFFSYRDSYPNLMKIMGGIYQVKTREFRQSPAPPSSFCPDQAGLDIVAPDGKSAICKRFLDAARMPPSAEFFLWDPQTKQKTLITKENQWFDTPAFRFSPDGRMVVINSGRGLPGVVFWDAVTQQVKRHIENVSFKGFSADGQMIALQIESADRCACHGDDQLPLSDKAKYGAVELWDMQLKAPKRTLIGREVFDYSPDGRTIMLIKKAGADAVATLELWDAQLSALKQTLTGNLPSFSRPLFSPDGRMMALLGETNFTSESGREEIILYDLQAGKIISHLPAPSIPREKIAFSRDGTTLTTLSWSGEAKLWDTRTGALKSTLKLARHRPKDAAFSADGQLVVSGTDEGAIVIWNFHAGRVTQTVRVNSQGLTPGFSYANQKLLHWQSTPPGAPAIPAMAWNLNTLKAQPLPPDNAEKPLEESKPTLSPDGRLSAKLSGDSKSVTLYDARTGKQMRTLDGRASAISSVIFAPDSSLVATVSGLPAFDGRSKVFLALATVFAGDKKSELDAELNKLTGDRTIKLWDAQTGQLKQTLQCAGVIHQARFLSDGAVVIATHSKAAKSEVLEELMEATGITVWDAETGKTVKTMNAEAQASFLLSPDGSIVISRGRENIRALDARTGELKWETSEVEVSPLSNDPFTPDGKLLVAETKYEDLNSATKLLDVQTGRVRWSLPKKGLTAFSPDGRTLVCFSAYHASLWDLGTGKLNWSIITPQSGLSQPALLRDGKLVAVFGQHYAIELRDARDGRLLVSLLTLPGLGQARENEEATPEWIAFTPEGYYSASPGAARYIRWRVGEKLLPAEAYAKEFNRPDLVQKALQAQ